MIIPSKQFPHDLGVISKFLNFFFGICTRTSLARIPARELHPSP